MMEITNAIAQFDFAGRLISAQPLGIGNINDSFLLAFDNGGKTEKYTLQRLNTKIFKNPDLVMDNIVKVTGHLRNKVIAEGGNPDRETLNFVPSRKGGYACTAGDGGVYRAYRYIDGVTTIQSSGDTKSAYKVAYAFGVFQRRLSDFQAGNLAETIPDFHNTKKRLDTFNRIVESDPVNRATEVKDLIAYAQQESYLADQLTDPLAQGILPVRVTHNDTKINNILFDDVSGNGICVIDLDTVMPGSSLYDFGDMVRSGASATEEDDTDLSRVKIDLDYYKAFVDGFSAGVGGGLTDAEMSRLALSAKVLTYELCIRFLGDYIDGDTYFSIRRPSHNRDRAANQLRLLRDMEDKYEAMLNI